MRNNESPGGGVGEGKEDGLSVYRTKMTKVELEMSAVHTQRHTECGQSSCRIHVLYEGDREREKVREREREREREKERERERERE